MENEINQIIKQVKKGNKDAFGVIIDAYERRIYQHCYRLLGSFHDAEEVTQEAFVKAYTKIHTFKNKQKFSPWIYRIATNTAVDWMRKKKPLYILDQPIAVGENITYLDHVKIHLKHRKRQLNKKKIRMKCSNSCCSCQVNIVLYSYYVIWTNYR